MEVRGQLGEISSLLPPESGSLFSSMPHLAEAGFLVSAVKKCTHMYPYTWEHTHVHMHAHTTRKAKQNF